LSHIRLIKENSLGAKAQGKGVQKGNFTGKNVMLNVIIHK